MGYTGVKNEFFGYENWVLDSYMLYTVSLQEITIKLILGRKQKCAGPKTKMAAIFSPKSILCHLVGKLLILEKKFWGQN